MRKHQFLVALAILVAFFSVNQARFFTLDNFWNVLDGSSILLIVSVGLTFTMLASGFDLSLSGVLALGGVVGSAACAPTKQSYEVFEMLSKAVDEQLSKWKAIVSTDVKAYDELIKQQEIPALIVKQAADGR